MYEWIILTSAHLLKTAVVAGVALVSWGVDALTTPVIEVSRGPAVTVCCHDSASAVDVRIAITNARLAAKASKLAWVRAGTSVPPIRIETLFTPDVLHPVLVAAPAPPPAPAT